MKLTRVFLIIIFSLFLFGGGYLTIKKFFSPKFQISLPGEKEGSKIPSSSVGQKSGYPFDTQPFEKGYQFQNLTITLEDLEKKFNLYYSNSPNARKEIKNWEHIASLLTEEAILQNEAIKAGVLTPSDKFLDPKKVNLAREYFEKEGTSYLSGEAISIWFYNTKPPAMGVEAAKRKTQQIIESLRSRIISGEISMSQAGQIIASMTDLEEIDFAYKTNAYSSFEFVKPSSKVFNDPEINNALWKLNEQEVSPILIGKDFSPEEGWYEAYFKVIKVNSKKIKEFDNIDQLIKKRTEEELKITLLKI